MRLKIPAPVQTWFNTLGTSTKRRTLTEEELHTPPTTVATPLVIESLQNLCYEIFAIPVCTADSVSIAQTICRHIYGLAQSNDPSLHLLVLDLLPTLVHVYLVLSTTLSCGIGNFKTDHRASRKSHARHKHSISVNCSATTSLTTEIPISIVPPSGIRTQTSFRSRLKKSSIASVRHRTHRFLKGFNPDASGNVSNMTESPPQKQQQQFSPSLDSSLTAKSSLHFPPSLEYMRYVETIGMHMTNLAAVLEALLLGLYNTFARNQMAPSVYSALPPFSSRSVFCGPLNVRGKREEQDGELVEALLQLFSNPDPSSLLINGKKDAKNGSLVAVAGEEMELTPCNRWRILRLLCRLCSERIGDLTERGRAALCHLALLLGPYGLREHRLPPSPVSFVANSDTLRNHNQCSTSIHHHGEQKSRWRGFSMTQSHHRDRRGETVMRTSTPMSESCHHKYGIGGGGRIDLSKITAPLKRGKLSVRSAKVKLPPQVNIIGPSNDHTDNNIAGLGNSMTAVTEAAISSEEAENDDSRVVDELLLGFEDEDSEIVVEDEAASRSLTASPSIPQGASSSYTSSSSEVSSIVVSADDDLVRSSLSSSHSSSASTRSFSPSNEAVFQGEADLLKVFGALTVVGEEEIFDDKEATDQFSDENPLNVNEQQKRNRDEDPESEDGHTSKNGRSTNKFRAIPGREIPIGSVVDDLDSIRSIVDASVNSLNEKSSIALKEKVHKTTRRGEMGERDKRKKSKRKHFPLGVGSGSKSSGIVGVSVASARIPQLPPYFVLELLPGLHFILCTVQSHLAVSAIHALAQRASLELWSNVLLYTNSICNSKLYYDVTDETKTSHLNGNGPGQIESIIDQSTSTVGGHALSSSGSVVSSDSSHASLTLMDHHQTTESSALNRSHRKAPITNASFQVVRPEEDIPLVLDRPSQIKCTSLSVKMDARQRPKSQSPQHQSFTPMTSSALERVPEVPRGFRGLHCGGLCGSGKTSRRYRTLSFNPRLCSALKTERPKSPNNHKVTFMEDARGKKADNHANASESLHSA